MQLILFFSVVIGRQWKTCTDRVSFTSSSSLKRRPYSNCRQLCHSLRAEMVYWQSGGRGVHGSMQQRLRGLCDRRTYIIYVGLQCAAALTVRETDSPWSYSVSAPPTGPQQQQQHTIRFRVVVGRSGQGWRTICSLACLRMVRVNWSPCGGSPPVVFSRSTPFLSSPWPSRLQAPLSRTGGAGGGYKHHASGYGFKK